VIGYDSIEYASLTDVGVRRSHNQDAHASLLAGDPEQWKERGHIFLVADGMGAHAVGEMASELAVNIIPHTYHKYANQGGVPALRKAFVEANASIHAKGQQNPEFGGMGTTTTALLLRPEGAWIGHVGDSRAYRIRDGKIEQMSFDHSLVWEMARRQGVPPEDLQGIPSNVIVRSLGPEPLVQVDVEGPYAARPGDTYLLCSDGLSGQVADHEMGAIASVLPPAEACRFLVDLANLRGGPDNITVVIVRLMAQPGPPPKKEVDNRLWYKRLPWPAIALTLGVLMVFEAAYLTYNRWTTFAILSFLAAAGFIVAGVVGVALTLAEEKRRLASLPAAPRQRMYRETTCVVDRPLVERLARAVQSLKQQVQEKQWELDWGTYQRHCDLAEELIGQNKLVEGFREYCRAMHLLADAVERQRPRGEVFQPLWDLNLREPAAEKPQS
jgi:protein phosphatase